MTTVADQFTDSQIDEMKEAFNLFDRNKVKTAKSKTQKVEYYVLIKHYIMKFISTQDGNVLIIQLGSLLKMLGIHTTDAELKVVSLK